MGKRRAELRAKAHEYAGPIGPGFFAAFAHEWRFLVTPERRSRRDAWWRNAADARVRWRTAMQRERRHADKVRRSRLALAALGPRPAVRQVLTLGPLV